MRSFRLLIACLLAPFALQCEQASVTVLATTDLHGNLLPWDYFTARPADRGLARLASHIRAARAENSRTLLLDCGDTIQGAPLVSLYQSYLRAGRLPLGLRFPGLPFRSEPMMLAMNQLGYDAMVLGNHEFNFGLKSLDSARADARFPWLSANTTVEPGSGRRPFDPYLVKRLGGIKVALIGITTPSIPNYEKPENYRGYRFLPGKEAAEAAVRELQARHQPDLIVAGVHDGFGRDSREESMLEQIAAGVPGIDAIVFGHTHQQVEGRRIGKVLLAQPKNWGISMARVDFRLERQPGGRWRLISSESRLLEASKATASDEQVVRLAQPYHELAERYLNTPVARSEQALDGRTARFRDSALVDAIHAVQLHYAKADVSFTALFNPRAGVPRGDVTVRQIAALYVYDNELYAIEGNGKMVREALENAARFFHSCRDPECRVGPLVNPAVIGYNYDMAQGVDYEVDLRRPEGQRIRNLRFRGAPLEDTRKLRIALNNYRAAGSAGYGMFKGAPIVWRSYAEIRDLIVDYYLERKALPDRPDNNWRILPEAALRTLTEGGPQDRPLR